MQNIHKELQHIGLLPSVTLENAADFAPLAHALKKAGVPCVELFYNAAAAEALGQAVPGGVLVGARVSSVEQAASALQAGARFITGEDSFSTVSAEDFPGGRFLLPAQMLESKNWEEVTRQVQRALLAFLDFNLRHVGINSKDETESSATASLFERIFGFSKEDRGGAYFAGDIIEVMKKPFYGAHGHIAISTADAGCAARYLEDCGVKLNWQSAGYNPDGRLRVVYLQDEIGGFAVHILQK